MPPVDNPADPKSAVMEDLESQIAKAEAELTRTSSTNVVTRFGPGAVIMLAGVTLPAIAGPLGLHLAYVNPILIGYLVAFAGAFIVVWSETGRKWVIGTRAADLELLRAKKRRMLILSGAPDTQSTYFDRLVAINLDNLAAYYALVKVQTNKSFNVAVCVGIVGFAFVIAGLVFETVNTTNGTTLGYVSTGAGVITEFISGVFFYLYNRTVLQMKGYHDSLLSVQNVLLSFKLVDDTKNETEKGKMISQLLGYLVANKAAQSAEQDDGAPQSKAKAAGA